MQKKMILLIACLSVFFETIDVSAVNLAIPSLQREWHSAADYFDWIQSIYVLFYGGFLLLGGRLSDKLGRKRIYIAGSGIFLLASLAAFFAVSLPFLLVCRAAQGVGAALAIPAAISIISNLYDNTTEVNKGLGIFGAFAAIGFASGLVFGAIIVNSLGWKWIFGVNMFIITPVILLALKMIPADKRTMQQEQSDFWGGALLTLVLLLLTFAIHASGSKTQQTLLLPALLLAILFFFLFRYLEKKTTTPLFNTDLFRNNGIISSNLTGVLMGASFMSYISLLSIYVQQVVSLSLIETGLLLFPFSLLSAAVSKWWLPMLQKRWSLTAVVNIGLAFMTLSGFLLAISSRQYHWVWLLLSVLFNNGLSMAIAYPSITALSVHDANPEDHGMAAGLQATSYSAGCGIGIAFVWTMIRTWYAGDALFSSQAMGLGAMLCALLSLSAILVNTVVRKRISAAAQTL
jgi:MFS family permease